MSDAAGGVVWRISRSWQMEVLVVHRPHRRDWSLPKGKLQRGESAIECAIREVREETGLRCIVGPELPEARYVTSKGRPKRVRYWAMEELEGAFRPNAEVDVVRWVHIERVGDVLTYGHDIQVVEGLHLVRADVAVAVA